MEPPPDRCPPRECDRSKLGRPGLPVNVRQALRALQTPAPAPTICGSVYRAGSIDAPERVTFTVPRFAIGLPRTGSTSSRLPSGRLA